MAGVGALMLYRGAAGSGLIPHTLAAGGRESEEEGRGFEVKQSLLIDKSPEELYSKWRDLENLPRIMRHLKSVNKTENGRTHWIAKAPAVAGGQVEWDAEIVADEPNERIEWRSLAGSDVETRGAVEFRRALGDRGTVVHVRMAYFPPAGIVGKWVAKLFGEDPASQIKEDLRDFKRLMEVGEIITTEGQPRGSCRGLGRLVSNN
jgi:uncharacterized membrane protein